MVIDIGKRGEDEAHRAIGHYIAEFSMLIRDMREGIEYALHGKLGEGDEVARLALGEATAQQIANAYFAICEHRVPSLDDEEVEVMKRLRKRVGDTIKDRNDFAHGDWYFASSGFRDPHLVRVKPGRRAGARVEIERPIEEIDAMAEAVGGLDSFVVECGWLCLDMHPLKHWRGREVRIRDIYRFKNRKVHRTGRFAEEDWFGEG